MSKVIFFLTIPFFLFASLYEDTQNASKIDVDIKILKSIPYYECFKKSSEKYNIPLHISMAIAKGESDFNHKAISIRDGKEIAHGIMQIQWPQTGKYLGFKSKNELYNACKNIDAGVGYFSDLLKRYKGSYYYALAAYNYGPTRIKYGENIPNGAKGYVNYILTKLEQIIETKEYILEKFITFSIHDYFYYAKKVYDQLRESTNNRVKLDIQKINDKYMVRLLYKNAKEKRDSLNIIKQESGFEPLFK